MQGNATCYQLFLYFPEVSEDESNLWERVCGQVHGGGHVLKSIILELVGGGSGQVHGGGSCFKV